MESLSWNQLSAYTPYYLRELGVAPGGIPGWTAAMASLSWVIGIPLAPFWGVWADRYSRKAVIVRSALVEAVIFAGWALSPNPAVALLFKSLSGFVLGNTGVMLAVQAETTPRERLGVAVGIVAGGSPAGRAIGPLVGAWLIRVVDVRGMLLFDAAASLAIAGALTMLVTEPPHVRKVGEPVLRALRAAVAEIGSHGLVWRLFLALGIIQVGFWTLAPFLPLLIQRLGGYPTQAAAITAIGLVLSAMAGAQAVSSPLWGRLVDKLGAAPVLVVTSSLGCAAMVTASLAPDLVVLVVLLVIYGAAAAAVSATTMAMLTKTVGPERRGAVLGQVLFPFYLGGLVGPPIGAALYHANPSLGFFTAGAAALAPLVLLAGGLRRGAGSEGAERPAESGADAGQHHEAARH